MFKLKKIKELELEIENQDKQYSTLQAKYTKALKENELLEKENKHLQETSDKYLDTVKRLRKRMKELKNEETGTNSTRSTRNKSKS